MPNRRNDEVTLLLVEDDDIDAMCVERGFKKQRISNSIIRANDGLEAIEMMKSGSLPSPYVVLLDLQMPRMNGIEFLAAIRDDNALKNTVVFVLTTSKDEQDILGSYNFNIAGYFVKDELGESFLDVINLLGGYWKVVHLPVNSRDEKES